MKHDNFSNSAGLKLYNELISSLGKVTILDTGILIRTEQSISICDEFMGKLKKECLAKGFETTEQEIDFFKNIKPKFLSELIFHITIYNIESKQPNGPDDILAKYLAKKLKKLNKFLKRNNSLVKYIHSGSTFLDEKMFLRGRKDIKLFLDPVIFSFDEQFSTSHDHKVAMILANKKIAEHLKNEIQQLKNNKHGNEEISFKSNLHWTDNKVSLVELIYALHTLKCFNSGKADLSTIAGFFQTQLDVDLGDIYRRYLEIKGRKYKPTKFLDMLKEALLKKMEEELE